MINLGNICYYLQQNDMVIFQNKHGYENFCLVWNANQADFFECFHVVVFSFLSIS